MTLAVGFSTIALGCYIVLMVVAARQRTSRTARAFMLYLGAMAFWQFTALMVSRSKDTASALLWYRLMTAGLVGQFVFFLFFALVFLDKRHQRGWFYLGWLIVLALLGSSATDLVIASVSESEVTGLHVPHFGALVPVLGVTVFVFVGYAAYSLLQRYRTTRTELERSRIRYLLIGAGVSMIGSFSNLLPVLQAYPTDVAANVITALIIAYAIFRHQLLDITDVVRRGLFYSIPTVVIGAGYFLTIFVATRLFRVLVGLQVFVLSFLIAIVAAVVAQPLHNQAQGWIDRIFFREKYDSSLMLQRLSGATAAILDLGGLTDMILSEVTSTMHIERAAFLVRQVESGEFSQIAQRELGQDTALRLRSDHPIASWLSAHTDVLTRHDIDVEPLFKAIWSQERAELERVGAELFIPLKAKGMLVGILAVGSKLSQEPYSQDDQLTLTTLANQTAVAIENARLYSELQETLNELREAHDKLEMRVQERTAELARTNEALRAEVVERARAETQLKASLTEKEVLLKEIHHRVKNNLQIISGLLLLQSGYTKDREVLRTLQEARDRVHSMASIHEVLYQSGVLAHVDFAEYTQRLIDHLFDSYSVDRQAIVPRVQVSKVSLSIDTAISCGLIINELVTNALKHAFPAGQGGEIVIDLHTGDDNEVSLSVSDNGVGLPPDMEYRQAGSLGLQLVTMLTDQIAGTIELDKSDGTSFKIVFSQ